MFRKSTQPLVERYWKTRDTCISLGIDLKRQIYEWCCRTFKRETWIALLFFPTLHVIMHFHHFFTHLPIICKSIILRTFVLFKLQDLLIFHLCFHPVYLLQDYTISPSNFTILLISGTIDSESCVGAKPKLKVFLLIEKFYANR